MRCVVERGKSLQACPTLCDSMDGSPPGSSVCAILQARILEWVFWTLSSRVVMGWRTETDEHIVMSPGQCHEEESLPCRESKTGSQQQWSWTDRCWQVDRAPEIRGHGSRKGRFFPEEKIVHTSLQDSLKPGCTRTQGMCPEWPGCWETCTPTSCLLLVPPPPPEVNSFPFLLLRVLLILNPLKICFLHKAFQDYTLNRQALNSILFLYIVIQRVHNRSQLPTKL